ncbi:MAG TPA: NYN domain-containing protein [Bacillales bacterium]|nr:NYN domain-containing protein [Bacillales bacterium]
MDILLVDGYNMIGAWPELQKLKSIDFAGARDLLVEKMAEYQAYMGWKVIVVFDAYSVSGGFRQSSHHLVDVVYTKENETADERIEKMAIELNDVRTQIHVATSDAAEQWTIFGKGALRKSARELLIELENIEKSISARLREENANQKRGKISLSHDIAETFEKWRRGRQ